MGKYLLNIEHWWSQNAVNMQRKYSWNAAIVQPICSRLRARIQPICSQYATNMQPICSQFPVNLQSICSQYAVNKQPILLCPAVEFSGWGLIKDESGLGPNNILRALGCLQVITLQYIGIIQWLYVTSSWDLSFLLDIPQMASHFHPRALELKVPVSGWPTWFIVRFQLSSFHFVTTFQVQFSGYFRMNRRTQSLSNEFGWIHHTTIDCTCT